MGCSTTHRLSRQMQSSRAERRLRDPALFIKLLQSRRGEDAKHINPTKDVFITVI